jgi:hypothetical protein
MDGLLGILIRAGVVSVERAREARRQQVVFGDRIGTNLLALGYVTETNVAGALGALYGVPWAAGVDADSKPALTRTLPRQMAARLSAVPARVEPGLVSVFVVDPADTAALTELVEHYKRPIQPIVVVEGRMWALLHKFYLVRRGMRALKLDGIETRKTALVSKATERRSSSVATTLTPSPAHTQATSSTAATEAAALLAAALSPALSSAPALPPLVTGHIVVDAHDAGDEEPPWLNPVGAKAATTPRPSPAVLAALANPGFAEADLSPEDLELLSAPADSDAAIELVDVVDVGASDGNDADVDDVVDAPRETSPLSFDEARSLLAQVHDRNEIARIVLRYTRSRARRGVLLTVQPHLDERLAMGWDLLGEGLAPSLVHDLRLSLSGPSVLRLADETRGHVLGPLSDSPANAELSRLLGGAPKSAFVAPILASGRVVNLLYLDDGPGRFMPPDIGEVLILCRHINTSYDALLARG